MDQLIANINAVGPNYLGTSWPYVWTLVWSLLKIIIIVLPLLGAVA